MKVHEVREIIKGTDEEDLKPTWYTLIMVLLDMMNSDLEVLWEPRKGDQECK